MPSSTSMPTIVPPKSANEPKPLQLMSSTTIPPSMSFPAQLQQQHQARPVQPNLSLNKPMSSNLTSNLLNGTPQLTNQPANKIPMGQMMKNSQNTYASFPTQSTFGNNLMGMNSNYSMMNTSNNNSNFGSTAGGSKNNGASNNKSISLSAQEINDFLS